MNLRLVITSAIAVSMSSAALGQHYTQTNLVSDMQGAASVTDPLLSNPWGLSRGPGNTWWAADLNSNTVTMYDDSGVKQPLNISIFPPPDPGNPLTFDGPAGIVFNDDQTVFQLAPGKPAEFLFSSIGGRIAGWNPNTGLAQGEIPPSTHAVTMVTNTDGTAYTSLTTALIGNKRYLYAANFTKNRVDVFDTNFHPIDLKSNVSGSETGDSFGQSRDTSTNEPFVDDQLPPEFTPFNVQTINNNIVVTYALLHAGSQTATAGPGLGYVDIYSSAGQLLCRLQHGDWFNVPWGVTLAPSNFGRFSNHLLVAQYGSAGTTQSSGFIAAFDPKTGKFDGVLEDLKGNPISIDGIFGIAFANVPRTPANPAAHLFFNAGSNGGANGLFGSLTPVFSELNEGKVQ